MVSNLVSAARLIELKGFYILFLSLRSYLYSQSLCFNVSTQWEMVALCLEIVDLRKKTEKGNFLFEGRERSRKTTVVVGWKMKSQ